MSCKIFAAVILMTLAFAVPAATQYGLNAEETTHTAFRIGVFLPMGDTKNSIEPMLGFEYEFPAKDLSK